MPPRPPEPVPEDIDAIVEDACRFIEECRRRHARSLGLAAGEYLYLHVYRMNDEYIASRSPLKDVSLRDIADRTGYDYPVIRSWVVAAATRIKLRELGFEGDALGVEHFAALYRLKDRPRLALQLAEWADRERVTDDLLREWVGRWRRVIDEGGSLSDLRRKLPRPPRPRPGPDEPRPPYVPADDQRIVRVLGMVCDWVREARFSPARRAEILDAVRGVKRALG